MKLLCHAVDIENGMFTVGKVYTARPPRNALPGSKLVQVNDDLGRLRMILIEGSDGSAAFIVQNDFGNQRLPRDQQKVYYAFFVPVPDEDPPP